MIVPPGAASTLRRGDNQAGGHWGRGSPAETEALLATLTGHVVEVTQTRLTNVYDSVEAYNAATSPCRWPDSVLHTIFTGSASGLRDRAVI